MRITFFGHASFLLTARDGLRVITDPYDPGGFGPSGYAPIEERADIVTISHGHSDHNYAAGLFGRPMVVSEPGVTTIRGVPISGIQTSHDRDAGARRGPNIVFSLTIDGITVVHLGDLGHALSKEAADLLHKPDVLFAPVGGFYTINAAEAGQVVEALQPAVTIPMHFLTPRLSLPISPVDDFLAGKPRVKRIGGATVEVTRETLPAEPEVWVLEPAR